MRLFIVSRENLGLLMTQHCGRCRCFSPSKKR